MSSRQENRSLSSIHEAYPEAVKDSEMSVGVPIDGSGTQPCFALFDAGRHSISLGVGSHVATPS
jgi:hypothetical protein